MSWKAFSFVGSGNSARLQGVAVVGDELVASRWLIRHSGRRQRPGVTSGHLKKSKGKQRPSPGPSPTVLVLRTLRATPGPDFTGMLFSQDIQRIG